MFGTYPEGNGIAEIVGLWVPGDEQNEVLVFRTWEGSV